MDSLVPMATLYICTFDDYLIDLGHDLNDDGIGANLDDDVIVGVKDAEHEEEGIEAPICFFFFNFDLVLFLESGLHFFLYVLA